MRSKHTACAVSTPRPRRLAAPLTALQEHQQSRQHAPGSPQPARELVAESTPQKQGPEAQQLMREMLQHLGQAALQREEAEQRGEAEVARHPPAHEHAQHKRARVQEQLPGPAAGWTPASPLKQHAQRSGEAPACSAPAEAAAGTALDSLREAAWGAAADQQAAAGALMAAWVSRGWGAHHALVQSPPTERSHAGY